MLKTIRLFLSIFIKGHFLYTFTVRDYNSIVLTMNNNILPSNILHRHIPPLFQFVFNTFLLPDRTCSNKRK